MLLDWTLAKGYHYASNIWRLGTTKTPAVEKRFRKVFGFSADIGESGYARREDCVFEIENHLKDVVRQWKMANDDFLIALVNLNKTLGKGKHLIDLRLVYGEDLEALNKVRREKWRMADEICKLPAQAGYAEISTDIMSYLSPEQSPGARLVKPFR